MTELATAALAALDLPARDADAIEIWRAIEQLTDGEGDTVTVLCANPDFNGQPNYAIICNGFWTDWQDHRFADDSQVECFRLAARAMIKVKP
jgi:hypothetical protein